MEFIKQRDYSVLQNYLLFHLVPSCRVVLSREERANMVSKLVCIGRQKGPLHFKYSESRKNSRKTQSELSAPLKETQMSTDGSGSKPYPLTACHKILIDPVL